MSKQTIRILVADDHEMVRNSVISLLVKEPDMVVVGAAKNGKEAIRLTEKTHPDVVVMDVSMPILDGIRAAGKIHELGENGDLPKIIMLSMHYSPTLVRIARSNGASGYIMKQNANSELVPAIRSAYQGTLSL